MDNVGSNQRGMSVRDISLHKIVNSIARASVRDVCRSFVTEVAVVDEQ